MPDALRKSIFAVPFGCLVAVATHFVRFGDDHAFGGSANEAIASLAIGGSTTIALVILHAFLAAGSTTVTGTIARTRVAALLPNGPTIFTLAAAVYYGIETLEGNGVELGFPTLVLALLAALVALTLRGLCAQLARFAAQHANAQAVRNVATDEAVLWSRLRDRLKTIAGDLDMPMFEKMDRYHRAALDAFVHLNGKDSSTICYLRSGKLRKNFTSLIRRPERDGGLRASSTTLKRLTRTRRSEPTLKVHRDE